MEIEPALPLDLERMTFELVAELHPTTIPTLLRVCRRVHAWLEPLLYRVLNLDDFNLIRAIDFSLKPPSTESQPPQSLLSRIYQWYNPPEPVEPPRLQFFRNAVRHVFCTIPDFFANADTSWQTISHFLRLHPAVFELAVKGYSATVKTLPSSNRKQLAKELRPTRLTLELCNEYSSVDLTDPFFSSVTHLTLLTPCTLTRQPNWLPSSLAGLTHLCVTEDIAQVIMPRVFTTCPSLQAFVVYWWEAPIPRWRRLRAETSPQLAKDLSDQLRIAKNRRYSRMVGFEMQLERSAYADARIVLVSVPDFFEAWERGVRSGQDMWVCVEQFIASKRRGEREQNAYILVTGEPWGFLSDSEIEEADGLESIIPPSFCSGTRTKKRTTCLPHFHHPHERVP
ncbi:hypothetical protein MSAN_01819100 [Mycena sanguinolenta]|uniref:Uncharacterized protein n=1 Tax=Mycena sanguinolenta TaxID=230812 RepID=A0A8H6XRQ0_9AGAR|nr:hypothetical protein MSAN_01819100 [Mycena sanguinolenta]